MAEETHSTMTAADIASQLGGNLHGNGDVRISGLKPLELAGPEDLTFFAPTSKKRTAELLAATRTTKAGAILVSAFDGDIPCTQIVVGQPFGAMIQLAARFRSAAGWGPGVHATASVDPSAKLGEDVRIGPFAVIGAEVSIGARTEIHPHVVVYRGASIGSDSIVHSGAVIREFVQLGADCVIQNGAIIGGEGFGYIPDKTVYHRRIPHVGTVVLEDSVDIGANAAVDRATFGETRIRQGTKIDNLVQVGHNVEIGRGSLLCGHVGVSGSTTIGSGVVLGGKVGVADHVRIGDGVKAAAGCGIAGDVEAGAVISGYPHRPINVWRREHLLLQRLPELLRRLRRYVKDLEEENPEERAS